MKSHQEFVQEAIALEKSGNYQRAFDHYMSALTLLENEYKYATTEISKNSLKSKMNRLLDHVEKLKANYLIGNSSNNNYHSNNSHKPQINQRSSSIRNHPGRTGCIPIPKSSNSISTSNYSVQDSSTEASISSNSSILEQNHKTITIENDQTDITYDNLFSPYLKNINRVTLTDPYLSKPHQIRNLQDFCTVLYKNNVKYLIIETLPETSNDSEFQKFVDVFNQYLKIYTITGHGIHDREVILYHTPIAGQNIQINQPQNNSNYAHTGYLIRLGRGLDFYKPSDKYCLGSNGDFNNKKCKETNIDIMYKEFDKNEFRSEMGIIKQIKDIKEQCYDEVAKVRMKNANNTKHIVTEVCSNFICKFDNLNIKSTFKFAKAHRKEAIKQINSF